MKNTQNVYTDDAAELIGKIDKEAEKESSMAPINISKLDILPVKVKNNITGKEKVYNLQIKRLVASARIAKEKLRFDERFAHIAPLLAKEIIISFLVPSAFTNGKRIAMNPIWIAKLLGLGGEDSLKYSTSNAAYKDSAASREEISEKKKLRYIQYTLIHECLHCFYQHTRRAALKYGIGTDREREVANIAMDLEINRDIEGYYEDFDGCTVGIGGVWFMNEQFRNKKTNKFFEHETWEEVWDYLMESGYKSNLDNYKGNDPKAKKGDSPFMKGWDRAIEAIQKKQIDPKTLDIQN